jgi:hypothetical protein
VCVELVPRLFVTEHNPSQPNILIDAEHNPRLYDFANCAFTDNANPVNTLVPSCTYTIRWSAPEHFGDSSQVQEPTEMSDIYAFSMVIVEACPFVVRLLQPRI